MKFGGHTQRFDGACTYLKDTLQILCLQGGGKGADFQLPIFQVQLGESIEESQVTGSGSVDTHFSPEAAETTMGLVPRRVPIRADAVQEL